MSDRPYHTTFQMATITGVSLKTRPHGRFIRLVVEVPMDDTIDLSGLAHELYESPITMKVEKVQMSMAVTALAQPPEAAG